MESLVSNSSSQILIEAGESYVVEELANFSKKIHLVKLIKVKTVEIGFKMSMMIKEIQ